MELQNIITLTLLLVALFYMGLGVKSDINNRIFPNKYLLPIIIIGEIYAIYKGWLLQGNFGFILVNIAGIFFHKYHILSSGDMKYLSTLFFFIPLTDSICLVLILYLLIISMIIGYRFYKKLNKDPLQELKKELVSYKVLLLLRKNVFHTPNISDFANKEELLAKTMPFTVIIFVAFVLTIATQWIISII